MIHHRTYAAALSVFVCLVAIMSHAQTMFQGKVSNADGQPVNNVVVSAPELGLRTLTDDQGHFSLQIPTGTGPVQIRFDTPGYYSQTTAYQPASEPILFEVVLIPHTMAQEKVNVVASRLDIPYAANPAATAVVTPATLEVMPRGVGAEEAFATVPGVKVDNQADGERVHISIRGQGILSEHGLRGIQVLYEGIPLNDPTGFAPDLFDIDWNGVTELTVVRGPVGVLYGGGSSAGVLDIRTGEPEQTTHGGFWSTGGSNGFYKARASLSGIMSGVAYSLAISRTAGDGFREHSAFWGDNVAGRFGFSPVQKLHLNLLLLGTGYFNQNPEGLGLDWLLAWGPRAPNPDSVAFNEYQKTRRFTGAVTGDWITTERQHLAFMFFTRRTQYDEPVPSSVDHRTYLAPGGSAQYHIETGAGSFKNYFSVGSDLDRQQIKESIYPNLGYAIQGPNLVALQTIAQTRAAGYMMDRIGLGTKWTVFLSGRWDHLGNSLHDDLNSPGNTGERTFQHGTARVGASYTPIQYATVYASWGQGFLPPATEELESNPAHLGGFNSTIKPATSEGLDAGIRGSVGAHFQYDTAFFHLTTKNDFERYRIPDRPLETFYGNAGESSRNGVETAVRANVLHRLTLTGAYSYSHFTYSSYISKMYPGDQTGHFLPNSPEHQLHADGLLSLPHQMALSVGTDVFSRAYIDPINNRWIGAYGLVNARFSKGWQRKRYSGEFFVSGRNLTNRDYIAFTEPDYPDGHSYQPGPEREVFGGIEVRF